MNNQLPKVGDVIISKDFAFGRKDYNFGPRITVDGETTSQPVGYSIDEKARDIAIAITGDIPPTDVTIDMGAYDPSRGKAEFVVERAEMEGGSTGGGMNGHDDYPDGWHINARRLKNSVYDPKGEEIEFYMSGCFNCLIPPERVKIIRKMKKTFI